MVLDKRNIKGGGDSIQVGLKDGRILPLSTYAGRARGRLNPYDVIYVKRGRAFRPRSGGTRVEMRVRPNVQGTAIVLENKTGRVLAMVGSFSYPLSQLDRVTQARRQPGSSFKPMTYLAALNGGLQPNTLVEDAPITYPPIGGVTRYTRPEDYWSPHNYDSGSSGTLTIRRALEMSKNLVTARLLDGGIKDDPAASLDEICRLAIEAGVYPKCERYYPFVLGAQPVRPIDLAGFYAAIANEGKRPTPHVIEQIAQDGREIYHADEGLRRLGTVDPAAIFQLRTFLQGVVARGTAARMSPLSQYIGAKTGTSDDFNDAWFAGFSNDITVVVWVGYDNAKGKRTLGNGQAGGRVALPIFEHIMKAAWAQGMPQTPLPRPSPEAARHLVALPIDINSGQRLDGQRRRRLRLRTTRALRRARRRPAHGQRARRLHGILPDRRSRPDRRHPGPAVRPRLAVQQRRRRRRLPAVPVVVRPTAVQRLRRLPGRQSILWRRQRRPSGRVRLPAGRRRRTGYDRHMVRSTGKASDRQVLSRQETTLWGGRMSRLKLSVATTDYDHFRDFRLGTVQAEGIDPIWSLLGHHEVFARFTFDREWDAAELSFAKFTAQVTRKDSDIIGLPVVCSRLFRFSSFYVNKKSKIKTAKDLKGKTIGSPEWAHTAAVYMRGWLNDEHGIGLKDINWVQAGANEAGRIEKVELSLPKGVKLTRIKDKSLSEMIASGEIDCALIARPPDCFRHGHPDVVRLFPDYWAMEEKYYKAHKVWPIMHIIALQKRVLDENPWVARNLYNAFNTSKNRSIERMMDPAVSRYPVAWLPTYMRKQAELFGPDTFPYGIEENRATWEQMLRYTYEQGIAHRHAKPEEIFPKGIMTSVRV